MKSLFTIAPRACYRRCSILFHLLVTTTAWHQAWHLPSLTSNDELMPGCIAGETRDGEVGASCRLLWIGRKSRPFVLSPQCSSMNNARATMPAEILAWGPSCVSPTPQLKRE